MITRACSCNAAFALNDGQVTDLVRLHAEHIASLQRLRPLLLMQTRCQVILPCLHSTIAVGVFGSGRFRSKPRNSALLEIL